MDRDLPEHHVLLRRYDDLLVVVQGVRVHAPGPERRLIVRGGHHVDRQSSGARRWSRRAGRPPLEVAARQLLSNTEVAARRLLSKRPLELHRLKKTKKNNLVRDGSVIQ